MVRPSEPSIDLAGSLVGASHRCLVIAEAGVNHDGSLDWALRLVDEAVGAGADAIKFQTFRADKLASRSAPKAEYQARLTGRGESQAEMLRRLELDAAAHRRLRDHCQSSGIVFLSTPFDEGSADFLEDLGVPAFKVSSGEVTNTPFLRHLALKGRPIILSTGMSTLEEVGRAVETIRGISSAALVLLQCVSNYPADPGDVNLLAMRTMADVFDVAVGYSDHTLGNEVALAAVALGARVIEKHFTLDRSRPGPDHAASAEPAELRALVAGIRKVERALGDGVKKPAASEAGTAAVARRSLFAACDIAQGAMMRPDMLVARRPAGGLRPDEAARVLGRRALRAVREGEMLDPRSFE